MSFQNKDEINLLLNCIEPEIFRYILLQYNYSPAVFALENEIKKAYPERLFLKLSAEENDYESFKNQIYNFPKGIIFVPDFEFILNNDDFRIALNQRRDRISQQEITLIVCFPEGQELFERSARYMADFWSIRNLYLNVKYELEPNELNANFINFQVSRYSSLGGNTLESKIEETERIEKRLADLAENEENYFLIQVLLFQYIQLLIDTRAYSKATEKAEKLRLFLDKYEKNTYNYVNALSKICDCLAMIEYERENYEIALQNIEESIKFKGQLFPRNYGDLANAYDLKGIILNGLGNHTEFLNSSLFALSLRENIKPTNKFYLAISFANIASAYTALNEYSKALAYNLRALIIYENILSPNSISLAAIYNSIGISYFNLQDYKNAKKYIQEAINIFQKLLPSDHSYLRMAQSSLKEIEKQLQKQN